MDLLLPIIIILGVVLVGLFVLQRRQRANSEVVPPPDFSKSMDYTDPSLKEPETLGDRIRRAPLAFKLLVPLALIALLILGGVVFFALQPVDNNANTTQVAQPGTITEVSATLSNPNRILVQANTNLPNNTPVQAQLLEDGQPFEWNNPDSATGSAFDGRIRIDLDKRDDAPAPTRGKTYTIVLNATGQDGGAVATEPSDLTIPQLYAADFYTSGAAAAPTAAPTREPAATAAATAAPEPTTAATAAATPTATATLTATVANGGNVRAEPNLSGEILDQNDAFDVVTLLQKTQDGAWYQITNPRDVTGWFSASLLNIAPEVAEQVPVQGATPPAAPPAAATTSATTAATAAAGTTTSRLTGYVWNGGNVRAEPNPNGEILDQNNAEETVQLLAKTADGAWFKMTNPRGVTGWFSASLLRIDADVIAQVPVER